MDDTTHVNHPAPRQYVQIAVLLAVVTGIEVGLFYLDKAVGMGGWDAPVLLLLSALKFVIVVGWYMHIRYEKAAVSRFFGGGFVMAILVYTVVLAAMGAIVIRG